VPEGRRERHHQGLLDEVPRDQHPPKDFFAFYTHVETVLEQHGVKEVTEGCVAVDQNRAAIDGQVVLLQRFTADKEEVC